MEARITDHSSILISPTFPRRRSGSHIPSSLTKSLQPRPSPGHRRDGPFAQMRRIRSQRVRNKHLTMSELDPQSYATPSLHLLHFWNHSPLVSHQRSHSPAPQQGNTRTKLLFECSRSILQGPALRRAAIEGLRHRLRSILHSGRKPHVLVCCPWHSFASLVVMRSRTSRRVRMTQNNVGF
jgi:hypothetical protein